MSDGEWQPKKSASTLDALKDHHVSRDHVVKRIHVIMIFNTWKSKQKGDLTTEV